MGVREVTQMGENEWLAFHFRQDVEAVRTISDKIRNSVDFGIPRGDGIVMLEGVSDASPAEACRDIIRIFRSLFPSLKGA